MTQAACRRPARSRGCCAGAHRAQTGPRRPSPRGGAHANTRLRLAGLAADPVPRQAPQQPQGRLLHGDGLGAGRREVERPPPLHPSAARGPRPAHQRRDVRRQPAPPGAAHPGGRRADQRRPAGRRPDRPALRHRRPAGFVGGTAERAGRLGPDGRLRPRRAGQPTGGRPRAEQPRGARLGTARRAVGAVVHPPGRRHGQGLPPARRPRQRPARGARHRRGLHPRPGRHPASAARSTPSPTARRSARRTPRTADSSHSLTEA